MFFGNAIIQATQHIIHSCIRSEMFVNQAIMLFEQKYLQDISEVIFYNYVKSWCLTVLHEDTVTLDSQKR